MSEIQSLQQPQNLDPVVFERVLDSFGCALVSFYKDNAPREKSENKDLSIQFNDENEIKAQVLSAVIQKMEAIRKALLDDPDSLADVLDSANCVFMDDIREKLLTAVKYMDVGEFPVLSSAVKLTAH